MYVQAQNNSTSVDAPSIQIYDGDILKKEINMHIRQRKMVKKQN